MSIELVEKRKTTATNYGGYELLGQSSRRVLHRWITCITIQYNNNTK